MSTRGIVLFGINNTMVNYVDLAIIAASFIKKNMPGTNICLITDKYSLEYYKSEHGKTITNYFTHVRLLEDHQEQQEENTRTYHDTRYYSFEANFKNRTRSLVYEITPYDETLLLDSDYLICSNVLSSVWGSTEDVMINHKAIGLLHNELHDSVNRLSPYGIRMYWATAIYFRKSEKAKLLFDLVEFIKENWEYYGETFEIRNLMFRNDFAFSIAIHILNGQQEDGDFVTSLPDDTILTGLDLDQLYKVPSSNELTMFVSDPKETWKFYSMRYKGLNVHCMNKVSILNSKDAIMETLSV